MFARLKQLFERKTRPSPEQAPQLALRLPLPPTPDNAPMLAQQFVANVQKLDGVTLDYSVESLALLDSRILAFREQGATTEQIPETVFIAGCYFGEVLALNLGGKWFTPGQHPAGFVILAIDLGVGLHANPIGKVFKLLDNGHEDSTAWLFRVLSDEKAKRVSETSDA